MSEAIVKLSRFKWDAESYPIPSIDALSGTGEPSPEQAHEYESAGALLDRLERTIREWRERLPDNAQPLIEAIVPGGWIVVCDLVEQGHNGIAIRGKAGDRECLMLVHQANLQLLCTIEKLDSAKERTPIGFVRRGGRRSEA